MKRKIMIFTLILLAMLSMSCACASDANDTAIAGDDSGQPVEKTNDEEITDSETLAAAENFDCDEFTVTSPLKNGEYKVGDDITSGIIVKRFEYIYGANGMPTSTQEDYVLLSYFFNDEPYWNSCDSFTYTESDVGRTLETYGSFSLTYAGEYTVKVEFNHDSVGKYTFTVKKADNPLKVKGKTATVKFSKLKKKTQSLALSSAVSFVKEGEGSLTYVKASGDKKITINKKTGKITVKKGLKKGTYKVKVKIKAKGNADFEASPYKTVTFKIKVR